jgi:hypothetical protein
VRSLFLQKLDGRRVLIRVPPLACSVVLLCARGAGSIQAALDASQPLKKILACSGGATWDRWWGGREGGEGGGGGGGEGGRAFNIYVRPGMLQADALSARRHRDGDEAG